MVFAKESTEVPLELLCMRLQADAIIAPLYQVRNLWTEEEEKSMLASMVLKLYHDLILDS